MEFDIPSRSKDMTSMLYILMIISILMPSITKVLIFRTAKRGKKLNAVAVKAIDRLGNESDYLAKKVK